MFHGASFVMVTESQQAWSFFGLYFGIARVPYLFRVTFLCVLRSYSVVDHVCMCVMHIVPSPSYFLTPHLVDET